MWNQSSRRSKKTIFGGSVRPHEEVRALHKEINKKQAQEFARFEENFEKEADSIWGEKKEETSVQGNLKRELSAQEKLMILSDLQVKLKEILHKKQNL